MDRRMMIALVGSAAAAAAASSAVAQTASSTATGMGKAEMDHATRTGMAGTASLKVANLGLEKASNAHVKEFAKFEHDEQTTVAEILMSMDSSMKPMADPKMQPTIDKLTALKPGKEFDRDFVMAQIEGHEVLLDIQDDYLKVGKDRETVNATKLIRGMVKEHLALLADLKKMV